MDSVNARREQRLPNPTAQVENDPAPALPNVGAFFVGESTEESSVSTSLQHTNQIAETESHTWQLLKLALPMMALTTSRMLMGFIDVYMVGMLGTDALAAVSPASLFIFVLGCVGMGIAQSVQTFVSQADGRGEPREGGGYVWQTFYVAAVFGVLTAPLVYTLPGWFGWVAEVGQHPPAVAALELEYMEISLWSVPFAVLCAGLQAFFNGVQQPRIPLVASLISIAFNIVGNYVLIWGHFGFPEMGIGGAALATTLAWALRAVLMTWAMLWPQFAEKFATRERASMMLCGQKMVSIVKVGGPVAMQWLLEIGSWTVFLHLVVPRYGEIAMAATNAVSQYNHLGFMPAIGIGMALCSQVGFVIGAKRPDDALIKTRVALRLTCAYMLLVAILMVTLGEPLMGIFSQDPEVIRIGRIILYWAAAFQVFDAAGITYMNALRGAGDTRWPAYAVAFCSWVVFIGGSLLIQQFAPGLGISGPWIAITAYITLLGLMVGWRWRSEHWRTIKLFDAERPTSAETALTTEGTVEPIAEPELATAAVSSDN